MEPRPEVRGTDAEVFLNLLRAEPVQLAKQEGVGEPLGELGEATAEDLPELAGLDVPAWLAGPRRRDDPPPTSTVEFSLIGLMPVRGDGGPFRPPEMVGDLVLEDADEPGPLVRPALERRAGAERFEERFLNDVGREVGRAESQQREAIQAVLTHAKPRTLFDIEALPVERRGKIWEGLVEESGRRLELDKLRAIYERKPKTDFRRSSVTRRARKNLGDLLALMRDKSGMREDITLFMLIRLETAIAALRRFLVKAP